MNTNMLSFEDARQAVLDAAVPAGTENVDASDCAGRILAKEIRARENVPPFDRSPYDGYAFRAEDTGNASRERPAVLKILEEIPAGGVARHTVTKGTAVKILTGAPIPPGADAVIMFEKTGYTRDAVSIFSPVKSGANIIYAGEDVKRGGLLAEAGVRIDAGLCGAIAAQGIARISVCKKPVAGLISTGSELADPGTAAGPGKIYNSNRYTIGAALSEMGYRTKYLGTAGDDTGDIAALMEKGLSECDVIVTTGGVSAGDYDLTPAAMERAGIRILLHGVRMKPGMACAYGIRDGKLVCALSGNPASSLINLHAVAAPALRKILGYRPASWLPQRILAELAEGFNKPSPELRFLRGSLDLSSGSVRMHLSKDQGNVVLSASIGTDVMVMVPGGSGPVVPGTVLQGFFI